MYKKNNLRKIVFASAALLLSLSIINKEDGFYKTFADTINTGLSNVETKEITIPEDVSSSVKQKGIYKNKLIISWKAIPDVNNYLIVFDSLNLYVDNNDNKKELSVTLKCKQGKLIESDVFIYPINCEDILSFTPDKTSQYISISSSSLALLPKAPTEVTVNEAFPSLKEVRMQVNRPAYTNGVQFKVYNAKGKVIKNKTINFKKKSSKFASSLISKIDNSRFYKVKMRSYCIFNNKKKYGKWETRYITNQVDVTGESLGNENSILLKWNKIKGAKNYTIYGSTNGTKNFKEICTCKNISKIGRASCRERV